MLLYLYLEQLGQVTINKFCIATGGVRGCNAAHTTVGLVKHLPASGTAGSAPAPSACQIQVKSRKIKQIGDKVFLCAMPRLRPPINKFNNKDKAFYTNNIKNHILNVISLILIVCMIYYFIIGLTIPRLLAVTISFIISSSAFIIFNKTKFSKNKIIKILQKFVMFNIVFSFPIFVSIYFNITVFQNVCWVTSATEAEGDIMVHVVAGIVAAKLGAVAYKEDQGTPALLRRRLITAGAFALSGLIGVVVGIDGGKAILKTLNILENVQGRGPSIGDNLINCPIEAGDKSIPLIEILQGLFSLNVLEIVFIIILLLIVFNRYFYKFNVEFILKLVNKYLPNKITVWFKKYTNTSVKYNNKFTTFMFIVVSILLILVKLGNLYVTAELCNNIDDYVLVYNHIKGIKKAGSGTIFILLSLNSKNLKQNKLSLLRCIAAQPAVRLSPGGAEPALHSEGWAAKHAAVAAQPPHNNKKAGSGLPLVIILK